MEETWRPVPGFEHGYLVSNHGRVWSVSRNRAMSPQMDHDGYWYVKLCRTDGQYRRFIHNLVANEFLGPCPRGKVVNHKDGVKANNRADNFEYVTRLYNTRHAAKLGLMPRGARNTKTKLTEEQVRELKSLYVPHSQEFGVPSLAKRYGVHPQTINLILRGVTWRGVGRFKMRRKRGTREDTVIAEDSSSSLS